MTLNPAELATVLAALRYFQDEFQCTDSTELADLFPHFTDHRVLTTAEIELLCERLNAPDPEPHSPSSS